ncbi:MAG TPA: HNH endonuclease [Planctomycetaceae bacterium]|nr:HNH endonuclease [Planctomycetaceae bacterium]HRA86522.1 HNH endonuclease [Planctomycetaceae bacterium]
MAVDTVTRRLVRQRADSRCEYCHCHQDLLPLITFHVEHIIARQHGGTDDDSNLCLACHWCNFHKGPNLATLVDNELVPLFHPRQQDWNDHFALKGNQIVGITATGRGTVELFSMNDDDRGKLRAGSTAH